MTTLTDLNHWFGADINLSPTGDLQPVNDTQRGQQRILRRLLTNPGDYIWHPEYGAGLPAKVGGTADSAEISAAIRGQILLEDAVASSPEPIISVADITGGVAVTIQYNDAQTSSPVTLSFNATI